MPAERPDHSAPSRRRFLACAAGATGVAAAPTREEPEEVLPLRSIVSSVRQEGLLDVGWGRVLGGNDRKQTRLFSTPVGPSNLFLVAGDEFEAAAEATLSVFDRGPSVDHPVVCPGGKGPPSKRLWVVVYFGDAQTSPVEWTVTRAAVRRDRVRVTAARPDPERLGRDFNLARFLFWVPLGEPKEKAYTLEAYDQTNRVVIMTRRVVVSDS